MIEKKKQLEIMATHKKRGGWGFKGYNNTSILKVVTTNKKSKASCEVAKITNNETRNEWGTQGENKKTFHEVVIIKCINPTFGPFVVRSKTFL